MQKKPQKISKTSIQKVISAHQKAPLDYISPWEAHHHQLYLVQSQGSDSLQTKTKGVQESKQNVVHTFLSKIRRTHQQYQKSRILRNSSMEEKEVFGIAGNISSLNNSGVLYNDIRGLKNDVILKTEISGSSKDNDKQIKAKSSSNRSHKEGDEMQDIGFGKLQYTKNLQKQQSAKTQYIGSKNISFRFNKKSNTTYTQPPKSPDQPPEEGPTLNSEQSIGAKRMTRPNIRNRMFTEQQINNPNQVVFIKKKKNNNNITVVDINSTAQEFYEEEIRYTELKMVEKYRKLGRRNNVGIRQMNLLRRRCQTEQGRSRMGNSAMSSSKLSRLDSKMQATLDKQQIKKKYCFMQQLKDQTIVNKMQNIMRGHPSLANTILLTK